MDYLYVYDDKNNRLKMEIVNIFELEGYDFKYIIYKELDNSRFYLAKYRDNISELDTNISDAEFKLCDKIFQEVCSSCN